MNSTIDIFGHGTGTSEVFDLEVEQFESARQLARQCPIKTKQWSLYCQALAVSAFTDWLDYRAPRQTVEAEECTLHHPADAPYAPFMDAVSLLRVGKFRICLLPNLAMGSSDWIVPKAVLDLPALAAHLYVVVGIDEEDSVAAIQGFLRHDQLQTLTAQAKPDSDWNYALPLCDLNEQPSDLLLTLDCFEPVPIVCPAKEITPSVSRDQLAAKISARRTQPVAHPWTWEQWVAILSDAPLRTWVYGQMADNRAAQIQPPLTELKQTLIDVRQWFSEQADTVCTELSWQLLPSSLSPAFRFGGRFDDPMENLLNEIKRTEKLDFPQANVRACTDIVRTTAHLRLYGITWMTDTQWSVVLVLGAPPGQAPALGASMQVSDASQVLWEQQLQSPKHYLYVQLSAQFNEVLTVTVTPPAGDKSTYLFTCQPSDS